LLISKKTQQNTSKKQNEVVEKDDGEIKRVLDAKTGILSHDSYAPGK